MALGGQIVDLGRLDLLDQPDDVGRVGHVAVMQEELHARLMRILVQVVDAARVDRGRAPLDAMDGVALLQQKFREIGRSEEHTSELQSLMRISYAVFCLKKKKNKHNTK